MHYFSAYMKHFPDHMIEYKKKFLNVKAIESMLSDHCRLKLEINTEKKYGRFTNILKLNYPLLTNESRKIDGNFKNTLNLMETKIEHYQPINRSSSIYK